MIAAASSGPDGFNFAILKKAWKQDYPCTKLVVPSRGSTIHGGSSVSSVTPQAAVVN